MRQHDPLRDEIARLADGIAALRIVYGLIHRRDRRMTPAEITKLTDQASRAKALMVKSSASGEKAKAVFDSYETTLAKFDANVAQVKANDVALNTVLSSMGNAEVVLAAAFQDDKAPNAPVAAAPILSVIADTPAKQNVELSRTEKLVFGSDAARAPSGVILEHGLGSGPQNVAALANGTQPAS